jgi:hypothetical protein
MERNEVDIKEVPIFLNLKFKALDLSEEIFCDRISLNWLRSSLVLTNVARQRFQAQSREQCQDPNIVLKFSGHHAYLL